MTVAWFNARDFEEAKKFYGQVLGLKKTFEMQQWAEFAGAEGEASIGVAASQGSGREPSLQPFAFTFDSVHFVTDGEGLQLEGAEGDALGGDVQCAAESEIGGAAN